VLSSETDLLPPEADAAQRRAVARAAEAVIAAIGDLQAPAAALRILAEASTSGGCPDARAAHAIEQARAELRNASALLRELPGPLRAQLLAADHEVEAAAQAVAEAARPPAASDRPARACPAEPLPSGQQYEECAASLPPWAPYWRDFAGSTASRGRGPLMSEMSTLAPAIAQHGGGDAVTEAIGALLDVGQWWS
jgi:hypothetical protein